MGIKVAMISIVTKHKNMVTLIMVRVEIKNWDKLM